MAVPIPHRHTKSPKLGTPRPAREPQRLYPRPAARPPGLSRVSAAVSPAGLGRREEGGGRREEGGGRRERARRRGRGRGRGTALPEPPARVIKNPQTARLQNPARRRRRSWAAGWTRARDPGARAPAGPGAPPWGREYGRGGCGRAKMGREG